MDDIRDFELLFKTFYRPLFVFAKRFIAQDEECHDLVGDVFEDVWAHYASIRPEAARQYMYTLMRRKCIDRLRHLGSEHRYIEFMARLSEPWADASRQMEMEERERQVGEALDQLGPTTRRIFSLCYVDHHKYAEAADILGISVSTVKKHIVRALRIMRERREGGA